MRTVECNERSAAMTDKELQDFIEHGENGFVEFAMVFGEGWAKHAIEIAKETRRLHEVNAELLEAVKAALSDDQPYIERCKAALVKATGEKNG
jgi:hypothetical protein